MHEKEVVEKLRESIIFETAWLYRTMPGTDSQKDRMLETIKVVWNRAFQRAGFAGHFKEFIITEEQVKEAAEFFSSVGKLEYIAEDKPSS